jgi:hypothetical protein
MLENAKRDLPGTVSFEVTFYPFFKDLYVSLIERYKKLFDSALTDSF